MRRIYSSPRIENVQRLVAVMAEHGIATKVTNLRVYDGKSYRRFSYARPGNSDNWLSVWVKHGCDHSRARQLMLFFVNEPATTETYALSLHDALPSPATSSAP